MPYASGERVSAASNPYTSSLAQSVMSQVLPGIQSQFIAGGGLSGPQAAYASSQGATAALAPVLAQQYQQEEQNQLQAGQALSSNYLQGLAAKTNAANSLNNAWLQGTGLEANAAQGLGNLHIAASGLAQNAATSLNNAFLQGSQQQLGAALGDLRTLRR